METLICAVKIKRKFRPGYVKKGYLQIAATLPSCEVRNSAHKIRTVVESVISTFK